MKRGEAGVQIHSKSIDRFKQRIYELTRRNQGRSIEDVLQKLRQYTAGWLNYYNIADMKSLALCKVPLNGYAVKSGRMFGNNGNEYGLDL